MMQLAIDQTSDGRSAGMMVVRAAVLAVTLGQTLVGTRPVDGVFDDDTPRGKGMVVSKLVFSQRRGVTSQSLMGTTPHGVPFGDALIGGIAQTADLGRPRVGKE